MRKPVRRCLTPAFNTIGDHADENAVDSDLFAERSPPRLLQPPSPEWGAMLSAGRDYFTQAPWLMLYPGLAIMVTVLAFNLLGDGIREALDPRQQES